MNVNFFSDRVLENIMSWNEKSKLTNRLWQLLEIPKKFCLLLTKRCRGASPLRFLNQKVRLAANLSFFIPITTSPESFVDPSAELFPLKHIFFKYYNFVTLMYYLNFLNACLLSDGFDQKNSHDQI